MKLTALLFLFCVPATTLADVEMKYDDGTGFVVSNGRVMFADGEHSVLFDPERDGLVILDHNEKTWLLIDNEFLARAQAKMQAQMARMKQMIESLPPEKRAMLEQQMPAIVNGMDKERSKFEVRKTGNHHEIAGYDCVEAEITGGEPGSGEIVCIATADELGISDTDFSTMRAFMDSLSQMAAMSPGDEPVMDFDALDGVPIRSENEARGTVSSLINVDTAGVDAGRIAIPNDYRELSMESMTGQ